MHKVSVAVRRLSALRTSLLLSFMLAWIMNFFNLGDRRDPLLDFSNSVHWAAVNTGVFATKVFNPIY